MAGAVYFARISAIVFLTTAAVSYAQTERISLSPQNSYITILGGRAPFTCYAPRGTVTAVQWMLNNTRLELLGYQNVLTDFSNETNIGSLSMRNIPLEQNGTIIHCKATFDSGNVLVSNKCKLVLQGYLDAVGSLAANMTGNSTLLTWTAPFTFHLPISPPYITYCVDITKVYNSSLFQPTQVLSVCGIDVTRFMFIPMFQLSTCDSFEFRVTPVNLVGNGTSTSVNGRIRLDTNSVIVVTTPRPIGKDSFQVSINRESGYVYFQAILSTLVLICSAELEDITDSTRHNINESLQCSRANGYSVLSFNTSVLPLDRHFRSSFNMSNCVGSATSHLMLSTYDVQTIEVRVCAIENCVEIKATYLENSQSQGVLIFLLPQGNRREEETDLRKAVYMLLNKNDIDGHFYQISGVSRGNYKVLVYNIESDGSLRPGGPATSARVNVTSGSTTVSPFQQYSNDFTSCKSTFFNLTMTVHCAYSSTATPNGYLVVLQHQNNLQYLEPIHFMGNASFISFNVPESEGYIITVFPNIIGRGLQGSVVGHTEEVMVIIPQNPQNTQNPQNQTSTTEFQYSREDDNAYNISTTMLIVVGAICSITFFLAGLLVGWIICVMVLGCKKHQKSTMTTSRNRASPIYEDIGPRATNTLFEFEKNEAYGHMK